MDWIMSLNRVCMAGLRLIWYNILKTSQSYCGKISGSANENDSFDERGCMPHPHKDGEGIKTAMKRKRFALFLVLGLSIAIILTVQDTLAALGESVDSVESDRESLAAAHVAMTAHRAYTVHEIKTDSTVIREYVSLSGIVFAVAWNGLVHPNLTELLGSYSGEYQEALQQTQRKQGRRQLEVKTNRVVVQKWGHIRDMKGRAYAPDLVPPGVSIDAIK